MLWWCTAAPCRADPFVEVGLSEKGEHLLGAAGEVHLETVVKDLRERFARVPFQVWCSSACTLTQHGTSARLSGSCLCSNDL